MARWTDFVVAHRGRVLAVWVVLFVLGGLGAANLGGLLSNRFSVPGSESERGLELLEDRMGVRSDGAFTLVAEGVLAFKKGVGTFVRGSGRSEWRAPSSFDERVQSSRRCRRACGTDDAGPPTAQTPIQPLC